MKKFFRIYITLKCIVALIAVLIAIFAPMLLAAPHPAVAAVASPQQAQSPVRQSTVAKTQSGTTSKTTINRSTPVPAKTQKDASAVKAGKYVIDEAGVLTASQFQGLEKSLAQLTAETGTYFGVAVRNVGMNKSSIGSYANQLADQCAAKSQNGAIVFVQDTKSRLWYIASDKKMKAAMPKNEHVEYISGAVVPHLKSNDMASAYSAFAARASTLAKYYTQHHKAKEVVDKTLERVAVVAVALGLGWLFATTKRGSMVGAMSNVHHAKDADDYVKRNSFNLTNRGETFLYNTVTVVPRSKSSGGGDDGSVSFSSADSDHGGGGGSY